MGLKKVLIITYYWPPTGGSGVQRYLYFTKYLRDFGWEPVIFTVENPQYGIEDEKLLNQIPEGVETIKQKAWEPNAIYKKSTQQKSSSVTTIKKSDGGWLHEIAVWVRGNFFIPDAKKYWIKPSIKKISQYLESNSVDAIISTSPPQSTHLIALRIHENFGIPWIADFRDPWTKIGYFEDLKLSKWARSKHQKLEKEVLIKATEVLTVTQSWQKDFEDLGATNVKLITNGFEPFDLPDIKPDSAKFTISYFGVLTGDRNPTHFWKAIKCKCESDKEFAAKLQINFIGSISDDIFKMLEELELSNCVTNFGYLPRELIFEFYAKTDVLFLVGIPNVKGVLPGKLFEYMYCKKPILAIGAPQSDIEEVLKDSKSGLYASYSEADVISNNLDFIWECHQKGTTKDYFYLDDKFIDKYSRKKLTEKLSQLLDNLID